MTVTVSVRYLIVNYTTKSDLEAENTKAQNEHRRIDYKPDKRKKAYDDSPDIAVRSVTSHRTSVCATTSKL